MYKIIRKKVAASVNSVDVPEQFEWGKWLRKPDSESLTVSKITSSLSNFKENLSFNLPETNSFNFQTKKVKLFKSKKQFCLPKEKTIKVFYKLGKSSTKRIKIFDTDSGKIIFSSSFNQKSQNLNLIKEVKETFILSNLNLIREIKEPFVLSNLNLIKEVEESFNLLESKTATVSIVFQYPKTKLKELPLVPSNAKVIDIKIEISKPASKNHYKEIDTNILNPDLVEKQLFFERSISNNTFQPVFIFLNEVPTIKNFDIPNVNQLIEDLDKDEASKKTNFVPIQFLDNKPQVKKIKIPSSVNPKISTYSYEINNRKKTILLSNEALLTYNISTYPYLFQIDNSTILGYSFEEIFKDYSCANWDIPLGRESIILNPEQDIEEKDISTNNAIKDEVEKTINDDSFGEIISEILKPEIIQPEKILINDEYLYDYQREGAEFLASNKIALLCDESGLGKTYQAISALKSLFKIGVIDKILIVCNSGDIGDSNFNEGWAGKLNELSADIPFTIIKEGNEENRITWKENKNIVISDYKAFFDCLNDESSIWQNLGKFNCVIFDEAQNLISNPKLFKQFQELKKPSLNYTWLLSNQLSIGKRIQKELNFPKNNSIIKLGRTKTETYRELPDVVRQDVWHELDDEQKIEYENILSIGRERITKLLQNGNPFIIQSNVFTLLHQLKQIYNFASLKNLSSKTEYLLKQIEDVIDNDKKILVFSQYDKMGIQKIEQVLNSNKIKFVMLHSGMSLNELEAAKKKFQINKKIHVLLNGIKSSRSGINLPEVQYIVHFDQWWNPATIWKTEANIERPSNENINVYNYFTKNTVEEKIKKLLLRKGLLRQEIIEFLSVESINEMVSLEEWLEILGIGTSLENSQENNIESDKEVNLFENKINVLSIDELSKKTEILFSRLGYKNLFLNKGNYEGEINIIGTLFENNSKVKMVAKCLFSSNSVDLENLMEYIEALQNDKNLGKNFIIHFNGLEEKLPYRLKKKIILINKNLFTNYLINFRLI